MAHKRSFPLTGAVLLGLFIAALAVGAPAAWRWFHVRGQLSGIVANPCGPDGEALTGYGIDDPAALCVYRAQNAAIAAPPEVVLIGDSLTRRWPEMGPAFLNRGIGKQGSAEVLLRIGPDAIALHPRIVHLMVGTNDAAGIYGPVTARDVALRIEQAIALLRAAGIEPVLGIPPPAPRLAIGVVSQQRFDAGLAALNARLRALAARNDVVTADYDRALAALTPDRRAALYADGTHLNAQGYAVIRRHFALAIEQARERIRRRQDKATTGRVSESR